MRIVTSLAVVAALALAAQVAPAQDAPQLTTFKSTGRIASGKVAKYDLKEESTDFQYRIRAERIQVAVLKKAGTEWRRIGLVKSRPPKPLNFWPVFKSMGTGRYRLVARAVSGSGDSVQRSAPRRVRFRVVAHIPHDD